MRVHLWLLPIYLMLTACNMAISKFPMFSREPRAALKLKDGLWIAEDSSCKFDIVSASDKWPDCADWQVLSNGKIVGARGTKPADMPVELTIAAGKPLIFEFSAKGAERKEPAFYAYIALEPVTFDSAGNAIDLWFWPIACGVEDDRNDAATRIRRFPGMDKDCHPASVDVLRTAAATGPQGAEHKKGRFRWIRATAN